METKKETLYIPMGLKEKNELWDGFGAVEARKASLLIFICLGINILISLFLKSLFFFIADAIISVAISLMLHTKNTNNISVMEQIAALRRFSRSQKIYYYKSLDEWR